MRKKNRNRIPTDVAILQALLDGEAYGLEIRQRLAKRTEDRIKVGHSALYPTLWKLEQDGFVTSRETEPLPERGGKPRKYYQLTAEGLRRAREDLILAQGLFGASSQPGLVR